MAGHLCFPCPWGVTRSIRVSKTRRPDDLSTRPCSSEFGILVEGYDVHIVAIISIVCSRPVVHNYVIGFHRVVRLALIAVGFESILGGIPIEQFDFVNVCDEWRGPFVFL